MKRFLLLAVMVFAVSAVLPLLFKSNQANAQLVTILTPEAANDTLTNTDTAYVYIKATHTSTGDTLSTSVVDNIARSVTIWSKKVSGTPSSCRAYLQGTVDGTNYTTLDSLVVGTNTYSYQTYNLRSSTGDLLYKTYRVYFLAAGTAVTVPKVYYLRRSN